MDVAGIILAENISNIFQDKYSNFDIKKNYIKMDWIWNS